MVGALVYGSHTAAAKSQACVQGPLGNWHVAAIKWGRLTEHTPARGPVSPVEPRGL